MKTIPFNLERAKAGDPILCEGKPARFLLHIPEADGDSRVVVLLDSGVVGTTTECGRRVQSAINPVLTMAPKKQAYWINVYPLAFGAERFETKDQADRGCGPNRIACVRVEFEEGDGL